jgi:hypothetical protein
MFHRTLSAAGVAAVGYLVFQASAFAGPTTKINKHNTTSGSGVILPGEKLVSFQVASPSCPAGEDVLITGAVAAPAVGVGNLANDVVNLGRWAVTLSTTQRVTGGVGLVPLVMHGNGPDTVSVSLPAGQLAAVTGTQGLPVTVNLLPFSAANNFRHEFAVHITTACGIAYAGN